MKENEIILNKICKLLKLIVIYLSLSKIIFKILIKYIDKYQYTEYNTI